MTNEEKINTITRVVNQQQETIEQQQQLIDRLFNRIDLIYRIFETMDTKDDTYYHTFFWD